MMRKRSFWLVALALAMLLTCTACGKKKAADGDAAPNTKQEQTVDSKTGDTARTEAKKLEEQKRLEEQKKQEEQKRLEEEKKKQDEQKKQPEQVIDPDTGKDKYQTDPVPEGKPTPSEPQDTTVDETTKYTCTISISCGTILANWDAWDEWDADTAAAKKPLVPSDGVILPSTTVTFSEGESVYDVLQRVCRENGIHMEASWTPMYNSAYVEGINNLYEFDVSQGSGWMYRVNGWFPNYGCSRYALQNGDVVEWLYTCDLGNDVGGGYAAG